MSDVMPLTRKERLRAETEALVAQFHGPISRSAGQRVQVQCECCAPVSLVEVLRAVSRQAALFQMPIR
jgi:hypothetical protein